MNYILARKKINIQDILLFVGIILLATHYFLFAIPLNTQMFILLALICLIGVPHGALDFLVDEQNENMAKKEFSIKKFVAVYVFKLSAFSIFWLFPWVAFSLFMVFSVFHFGETDMSLIMKSKKTSTVLNIAYGSFILSVLFLTHLNEIAATLPIMESFINGSTFYHFIEANKTIILLLFTLILFICIVRENHKKNITLNAFRVIEFLLLITVISVLPLLLAFAFYFALWHSLLSVKNIFSYVKSINNKNSLNAFYMKGLLFSLLALGSIVAIYYALQYFLPEVNLLFALLIGLSILTLPHLSVMHNMYKNFEKNNDKKLILS